MRSQTLSSLAGEKTGNGVELEDGFSELEDEKTPVDESLDHPVSDLDVSEVDSETESEYSITYMEKAGDKDSSKRSTFPPVLKIVMDAPRFTLKGALDQWLEEGNSVEQEDMLPTSLYLRRRRFFSKALQVTQELLLSCQFCKTMSLTF